MPRLHLIGPDTATGAVKETLDELTARQQIADMTLSMRCATAALTR